jgi:7-cyano-7-deazaguanine synthase
MCAIVGALFAGHNREEYTHADYMFGEMWKWSHARGRDGRGLVQVCEEGVNERREVTRREYSGDVEPDRALLVWRTLPSAVVGNLRAEPTTEHVVNKQESDQQPYSLKGWHIAHNGTIANDKELRTGELETSIDSAAIVEELNRLSFRPNTLIKRGKVRESFVAFDRMARKLKGSFAILAVHEAEPDHMMVAANYRPVWYCNTPVGVFFASARDYLPSGWAPLMIEPYTVSSLILEHGRLVSITFPLLEQPEPRRALVVCSGGMDSVVAAVAAQRQGYEIELVHFRYGSRAEGPEEKAISAIADALNVNLRYLPMNIYSPNDSPLLRHDSTIAGGEAGAEFAHEWVPARNLVMLALATAYAEAHGFDTLVLGNNLEEAGAYPDNEPEFINRFNDLLPFAVGDGKRIQVIMPVGNLMKHEIVALGMQLGAPLHLTWSCYRAGELHCGTCGPCFMRKTAFTINGIPEVIRYANEGE